MKTSKKKKNCDHEKLRQYLVSAVIMVLSIP